MQASNLLLASRRERDQINLYRLEFSLIYKNSTDNWFTPYSIPCYRIGVDLTVMPWTPLEATQSEFCVSYAHLSDQFLMVFRLCLILYLGADVSCKHTIKATAVEGKLKGSNSETSHDCCTVNWTLSSIK